MQDVNIYLKTTETCNLNCKHCFTNGKNGKKIFWNTDKIIDWIHRFRDVKPDLNHIHFEFHGGEPFLAPVEEMQKIYDSCNSLWNSVSWGVTTNLVFKLTDEIIDFMKGPLSGSIATSWDPKIRFENQKQISLWENNVRRLISEGIKLKLFVSVTKDTLEIEPIKLLLFVKEMGFDEISLERLTKNGNANLFPEIFPTNEEQDKWFLEMHKQSEKYNARTWFKNEFLENVYMKFESGFTKAGTFCRDCEEKLFTINADGTISGCPNSAPEEYFGNIDDDVKALINNPTRINNITCEKMGDSRCYNCEVFSYCGGDCHQLEWQNDVCAAPKSLMSHLSGINSKRKIIIIRES